MALTAQPPTPSHRAHLPHDARSYEVIQFYRTSTETTDVAALEDRFPELLTSFDTFLAETKWGDADATYEDLAVL